MNKNKLAIAVTAAACTAVFVLCNLTVQLAAEKINNRDKIYDSSFDVLEIKNVNRIKYKEIKYGNKSRQSCRKT